MSRIFGELRQLAFVVKDIDWAMAYWSNTLGIGPFFIKRKIRFGDYRYHSQVMDSPLISISLANSGYIQIELIQQHDDLPSIYRDFLHKGRAGLQHVAAWLSAEDFDMKKRELSRQFPIAQECTIASSGVRLAYFATDNDADGMVFEIADLLEPRHYERVLGIAESARSWDGRQFVNEVQE